IASACRIFPTIVKDDASAGLSCAEQRKPAVCEIALKTIVITGARGYIGNALAERLGSEGYSLRLVSRSPSPAHTITARTKCDHRAADLRDPQSWSELLSDADVVVHLSARTDLRAAEADPGGDEDINVRPLRALIEAAPAASAVPKIVFASAATIVGSNPQIPVNDAAYDRPCSIYDRNKLACETILREATSRGVVRACSLRLANVYGYGGASINANRGILNIMMRRAIDGEPLTLYGTGEYVRDFIHIDDVIDAFHSAIITPQVGDGGHYLIASGRGHTLAEAYAMIAQAAVERLQRRVEIARVAEPANLHPIEKRNFIGDSALFRARTGWHPRFDLHAGIADYFARAAQPAMTH
ncbi:MAG: NAD-dependent epimerase/dehydratase family protein, partial [Xanthobacteraceae bacterium]